MTNRLSTGSRREVAKNLLDICDTVKEVAAGLLDETELSDTGW